MTPDYHHRQREVEDEAGKPLGLKLRDVVAGLEDRDVLFVERNLREPARIFLHWRSGWTTLAEVGEAAHPGVSTEPRQVVDARNIRIVVLKTPVEVRRAPLERIYGELVVFLDSFRTEEQVPDLVLVHDADLHVVLQRVGEQLECAIQHLFHRPCSRPVECQVFRPVVQLVVSSRRKVFAACVDFYRSFSISHQAELNERVNRSDSSAQLSSRFLVILSLRF